MCSLPIIEAVINHLSPKGKFEKNVGASSGVVGELVVSMYALRHEFLLHVETI